MPIPLNSIRLDLDEATRFTDSSHEGEAQFRFPFRLQDGREEWLLARLTRTDESVFTMANSPDRRSLYCIILRPENAEAEQFDWELFPPFLLDRGQELPYAQLWRFWSVDATRNTYLFRFNSSGVGETREICYEYMGCGYEPEPQEEFLPLGKRESRITRRK